MTLTGDLHAYYAARAAEYDQVYAKPERQADLATLTGLLRERVRGADLLEIACGTGYWTLRLAEATRSILATDTTEETLALARAPAGTRERGPAPASPQRCRWPGWSA